jgi:hypothetical protein
MFLTFALQATPMSSSFMPDNDLHLEDNFFGPSNVSKEMFNLIVATGLELYQPRADENNEKLTINAKWDDATVNANCSRFWGQVTINMFGGLARRPEVSPAGFALVLCHELGHAYGGTPYIRGTMSAEGQADYYGANVCIKEVIDVLEAEFPDFEADDFVAETCDGDYVCLRGLHAGQGLGNLLSQLKNEDYPDYETPDSTIVKKTLTSYPKTVQCRLDSYFNGVMDLDRPKCWFAD